MSVLGSLQSSLQVSSFLRPLLLLLLLLLLQNNAAFSCLSAEACSGPELLAQPFIIHSARCLSGAAICCNKNCRCGLSCSLPTHRVLAGPQGSCHT